MSSFEPSSNNLSVSSSSVPPASKAATISQAQTLSKEVGRFNIRVNTIAPGLTNTDMMKDNTPEGILNDVISNLSLKRIGETEETLQSLFEQWLIVEFSDVSFKEFTEKFLKKYGYNLLLVMQEVLWVLRFAFGIK